MATILRAADRARSPQGVAVNLDDIVAQASQYLADVRAEAAELVDEARQQAESIRQHSADEGRQAAFQAVDKMVAEQLGPALAALRQAADDLRQTRQTWLSHWEAGAVHLATAIAARVIRREVRHQPEITLTLVREALELAAGSPGVQLHLSPEDHKSLGAHVQSIVDATSSLGNAEVTADPTVSRGGCRVETRFGTIDQQFETQLKRIEEELTGS